MYGTWKDIEDVVKQTEELQVELNDHKQVNSKAFAELYSFVEKQFKEESAKRLEFSKDITRVTNEVQKLKEYQLP